jgi:hypothetical protein
MDGIEEGQMSRTLKNCRRSNGQRALKRKRQAEEKQMEARNMETMT